MSFADSLICLAFSPDSQKVAYGTARLGVTIIHINPGGKSVKTFAVSSTPIIIAWSPNSERIIVASSDNKLRCWNIAPSRPQAIGQTFQGHKESIIAASFLSDNSRIISLSRDGEIFVWNIASGKIIRHETVSKYAQTIFVTALSADDGLLVTSDGKNAIAWEIPTCVQIANIQLPHVPLLQVAIIPNRLRQVVLLFGDMSFWIWDTRTRTSTRAHFEGSSRNAVPLDMTVSPDGELLALELDGHPTHFYNKMGKEFVRPNIRCVRPFAFSPDGKNFAASSVLSDSKDNSHKLVINSVKEIIGLLDAPAPATSVDKGKQRLLPQGFIEELPRGSGSAGGHVVRNNGEEVRPSRETDQQAAPGPTGPKRGIPKFWKRDRHLRTGKAKAPETVNEVPPARGLKRVAVSRPRKATNKDSGKPSGSTTGREQAHPRDRNRHNGDHGEHSRHDAMSSTSDNIHTERPEDIRSVKTGGCWSRFWNWVCF